MNLQWIDVLLFVVCFILAVATVFYIMMDDNIIATLY